MTVTINQQFDCTQTELVLDIARLIYRAEGYVLPSDPEYLFRSQHPAEQRVLAVAEEIFELFYGDSPDYGSDGEIEDEEGDRNE